MWAQLNAVRVKEGMLEGVQALRASLAEVLETPPEFTDLTVIAELVP